MGPGVPLAVPTLALECDAELLARAVASQFITLSLAAGWDTASGAPGLPAGHLAVTVADGALLRGECF